MWATQQIVSEKHHYPKYLKTEAIIVHRMPFFKLVLSTAVIHFMRMLIQTINSGTQFVAQFIIPKITNGLEKSGLLLVSRSVLGIAVGFLSGRALMIGYRYCVVCLSIPGIHRASILFELLNDSCMMHYYNMVHIFSFSIHVVIDFCNMIWPGE